MAVWRQMASGVRVKRRGKSPPRSWRHGRQGKHHPEQDQIGGRPEWPDRLPRRTPPCEAGSAGFGKGWPDRGSRVGCWKRMATCVVEKWSPPCRTVGMAQNPAYRPTPIPFFFARRGAAAGVAWRRLTRPVSSVTLSFPVPEQRVGPHRLAWPRTPAFQAGNTGSNPVGDTTIHGAAGPWFGGSVRFDVPRCRGDAAGRAPVVIPDRAL